MLFPGSTLWKLLFKNSSLKFTTFPHVDDSVVMNGANRWINHVREQKFCPYIDSSHGKKISIIIERTPTSDSLLKHALALKNDKDKSTYVVVLPTLPVLQLGQDEIVSEMISMAPGFESVILIGEALAEYRFKQRTDPQYADIIEVPFSPCFMMSANWAPWPTVQFFKKSVLDSVDNGHQLPMGSSTPHPIAVRNYEKLSKLHNDPQEYRAFAMSMLACYEGSKGSHFPRAFYETAL